MVLPRHYWRAVFLSSVALQIALSAFLPLLVSLHRYFKPQPAILPAPSTPQPSEGTASSTVMGSSKVRVAAHTSQEYYSESPEIPDCSLRVHRY